jgi:hypothetical protein
MFLYFATAFLFLRFLSASANGEQPPSVAHVDAISVQLERSMSVVNLKEFQSASTIALQTGELTGYGFIATYLDSTCATIGYAISYPLNTCLFYITAGQEAYAVLTATSTAYVFERFSDSACTTAVGTAVPTPYTAAECSSAKEKFFVQSSISPPISKATATLR